MTRTLRFAGIVICGGMLLAPQVVCFTGAPPGIMKVMDFIRLLFPLTFYLLANLLIEEGRAREREASARQPPSAERGA